MSIPMIFGEGRQLRSVEPSLGNAGQIIQGLRMELDALYKQYELQSHALNKWKKEWMVAQTELEEARSEIAVLEGQE